jgi:hypothetical protein
LITTSISRTFKIITPEKQTITDIQEKNEKMRNEKRRKTKTNKNYPTSKLR